MSYFYRTNNALVKCSTPIENGTPISEPEFNASMAEVQKRIEEEQANVTPEPTAEDRISALEEIETQQDESITEIFEALFGAESEAES